MCVCVWEGGGGGGEGRWGVGCRGMVPLVPPDVASPVK